MDRKVINVSKEAYDAICKYGEGKPSVGIKKLLEIAEGNEGNSTGESDKEITLQYNGTELGRMSDDPFFDGWERTQKLEKEEYEADGPVCLKRINDNVYGFIEFGQPCACVYKKRGDY